MNNELNIDTLAGPTHNHSGLSFGNIPSMEHKNLVSNPKEAAMQGLKKMHLLGKHGLLQGLFPPHERPHLPSLRKLGFTGSDKDVIIQAANQAPEIFILACSSSNMWTANAATVTPKVDSKDNYTHFTPANLASSFHRSIETETTARVLKKVFHDPLYFRHHPPLPASTLFTDEGAANHTRFCSDYGHVGVHLFVYGKRGSKINALAPQRFPARQSAEASEAIARCHEIYQERIVFAQQHPRAIDAGIFHNDVISTGNKTFFLYHEYAFVNTEKVIEELSSKVEKICDSQLQLVCIKEKDLSLKEAVQSYLFNSQIITGKNGFMTLIAPTECQKIPRVAELLEGIVKDTENPIQEVIYLNLQESMKNGGGPACLRLRVPLTSPEIEAMEKSILLSEPLYVKLTHWVDKHYRDRLHPRDLKDPELYLKCQEALDELTRLLNLGSIYSFQKSGEVS